MPKRPRSAPTTKEEALTWIAQHATKKQMSLVTPVQNSRAKMYQKIQSLGPVLHLAQTWFKENENQHIQSSIRLRQEKELYDNYRKNWTFLSTFLHCGQRLMITIRPDVFFQWHGTKTDISEHYNDQKTKMVEVEIINEMPVMDDNKPTWQFFRNRFFRVRLLKAVKVEYAIQPFYTHVTSINNQLVVPVQWAYHNIPENQNLVMTCDRPFGDDKSWKDTGLRFVETFAGGVKCRWDAEQHFYQEALRCIFPEVLSNFILTFLLL